MMFAREILFLLFLIVLVPFHAQAFTCSEKTFNWNSAPDGTHYRYGNRGDGSTGGSYVCRFTPKVGEIYYVTGRFILNYFPRENNNGYTRYGSLQIRRDDSSRELGFRVLKDAQVYDGQSVTLEFVGDGKPVYVDWHTWNAFSAFQIKAGIRKRETNLRILDINMDAHGNIVYEAEISGNIPVSSQRPMCVDFRYASNGNITRHVHRQCLPQCNGKNFCKRRSLVARLSGDTPMSREENQIVAIIDPENYFQETKGSDNSLIFTFRPFIIEQMPTILENKGWSQGATVQRTWQGRRGHAMTPEGTTSSHFEGLDFTGGNKNVVTGIITIDWLMQNAPSGMRINKRIREILDPLKYRDRNAREKLKLNLVKIKNNSRRRRILPISHIYTLGKELAEQGILKGNAGYGNVFSDVYATVGPFPIYGIPVGYAKRLRSRIYQVVITEIAVVAFDSFDFDGTQFLHLGLGCWGLPNKGPLPGFGRTCVFNETYRRYRTIKGMGGDFINQSDSRRFPLAQPIKFKMRLK